MIWMALFIVSLPCAAQILVQVPLDLPDGATPLTLVYVPPGSFIQGSPPEERGRSSDEHPLHPVVLTRGFYLGRFEITQAQWEAVMHSRPAFYMDRPNHPVENVSWNDTQAFMAALNARGRGSFRLPTEAEWEYACRAGTTSRFSFGDALECFGSRPDQTEPYCEIMDRYMWWLGNNAVLGYEFGAKQVGLKQPNGWGLYDMHGNVWEWCEDWFAPYPDAMQIDPHGPATGVNKVFRGGSFFFYSETCRSAYRNYRVPGHVGSNIGFRLLLEAEPPSGLQGWEQYQ